jgi:hypothetical protein
MSVPVLRQTGRIMTSNLLMAIERAGLTESRIEALSLKLSPHETIVYELLNNGPTRTDVMRDAGVINPAQALRGLNAKFIAAGDLRRAIRHKQRKRVASRTGIDALLSVWELIISQKK